MSEIPAQTQQTATATVQGWLNDFDKALQAQDIQGVLALFNEECYWRDFLTFTWNLKTSEGQDDIQTMLNATLENARPSNWQLEGEATQNGDIAEAW
ncbi:MAG: NAD(P)/FAD-dependent oxidoreductase, partial [Halomonas sp.]